MDKEFLAKISKDGMAARAKKHNENKEKYRKDFLDDAEWKRLARGYGIRLPHWTTEPTPRLMTRFLRKLNIKPKDYLSIMGHDSLEDFARLNPDWPLRAFVGIILEYRDDRDSIQDSLRDATDR